MVLIFLIDFVELLRESGKRGGVGVGLLAYLTLLRLPAYAELTLPFAGLAGSIGAFLLLSRSSELVVMRAAGMSVWQFIRPGIAVAGLIGAVATAVYNPLSASARAHSERLTAELLGDEKNLFQQKGNAAWLRQDGVDGPSVMTAGSSADQGAHARPRHRLRVRPRTSGCEPVSKPPRRNSADGVWTLTKATVTRVGKPPETVPVLSGENLSFGNAGRRRTGLDDRHFVLAAAGCHRPRPQGRRGAAALMVQYQSLLARPLLMIAMVLLAATVSLKSFRFGKVRSRIITGLIGGFTFFILAEVSRQLGVAGLTTPTEFRLGAGWNSVSRLLECVSSPRGRLRLGEGQVFAERWGSEPCRMRCRSI